MYIKYAFKAGATRANMSADIAKLISNVAIGSLSSDCDQANTQIVANTLPSNWQYIDQVGDRAYVRSLNADGTTYKYASIYAGLQSNISGYTTMFGFGLSAFENWDSATHTGTNQAIFANKTVAEIHGNVGNVTIVSNVASAAGSIMIYVTNRILVVDSACVVEFVRDGVPVQGNYPCHMLLPLTSPVAFWGNVGVASLPTSTSTTALCRYAGLNGDICSSGSVSLGVLYSTLYPMRMYNYYSSVNLNNAKYRTPGEVEFLAGSPCHVVAHLGTSGGNILHSLGKAYELVISTYGGLTVNLYDEVLVDGVTYICLGTAPGLTWVQKG